jgi:precorrin-2/cobalt-factor-2 C20-methyltransferase
MDVEKKGTFYGIGVGPGDPELLTIKAVHALKAVDVLIAPKTEKKEESLALSIAKPYLDEKVDIIYQTFPMVKDFARHTEVWEENEQEILNLLKSGKNVAFLTLGDPMFYSTYIYIFERLQKKQVNICTIPGVPAFNGIAGAIGQPVVSGDDILAVIPATAHPERIRKALQAADDFVIMKVYKNFPEITKLLEQHHLLDHAVLVSRIGLDGERIIQDVSAHKNDKINYLSTILVHK